MDPTRVVRITMVRSGNWATGKVSVHLPGETRSSVSRQIACRVEDAAHELSELCSWALEGPMHQEGFWG